jgi:hypothetical protein
MAKVIPHINSIRSKTSTNLREVKRKQLIHMISRHPEGEFVVAEGFDEAVVGYDPRNERLIYDRNRMVEILMKEENMNQDEAWEFLEYNVFDTYMGNETPVFIDTGYDVEDAPLISRKRAKVVKLKPQPKKKGKVQK